MKLLAQMDQYIFKPLKQFFVTQLRFSTASPLHLLLLVLGLNFLILLMLASTNYLINFLAALLMIPLAALMQAQQSLNTSPSSLKTKTTLMILLAESCVYMGALLYNTNMNDPVFTFLGALGLLGLWLQHVLNKEYHFEIKVPPLELRYFLLALTTLLTLNFIYFLIFLVLVYGQIIINLQLWTKK